MTLVKSESSKNDEFKTNKIEIANNSINNQLINQTNLNGDNQLANQMDNEAINKMENNKMENNQLENNQLENNQLENNQLENNQLSNQHNESINNLSTNQLEIKQKSQEQLRIIKIGSRKSKLAVIQAEHVISKLQDYYNNRNDDNEIKYKFESVTMVTKGDKILDVALSNIGSKALFTKELEVSLLKNEIDLIVHSCKDLPTNLPDGLCISAILRREIPDDVLVIKKGLEDKFKSVDDFLTNHHLIFKDKSIGTSSLRRIAQLKKLNNKIKIEDIRGNIDTRLMKLDDKDSPYSALILAGAGLKRAGFENRITASLNQNWWYAVGQGALAVECREGDEFIQNLIYPIIDHRTTFEVVAERSFMQYLEGGCSVPLGVRSEFIINYDQVDKDDDSKFNLDGISHFKLSGCVVSLNGEKSVKYECRLKDIDLNLIENSKVDCTKIVLPTNKCPIAAKARELYYSCAKFGVQIAKELQNLGAQSILDEINKNRKPIKDD